MNLPSALMLICFACLLGGGCQRPLIVDDDDQNSDEAAWDSLNYRSERLIQVLYATPHELYALSENQFTRFDAENNLLEKRPLAAGEGVRGIPAVNDNAFVRMTLDFQTRQVLEFHLSRNPAEVRKVLVDTLTGPGETLLRVDDEMRALGAFNPEGDLYLLPVQVLPAGHYALLLFKVKYNSTYDAFVSVALQDRVDLPELGADDGTVSIVHFLDGNFYVASREGAWRVSPSGEATKIFSQWMLDFFSFGGKLYAVGYNSYDLHKSENNGLDWERLDQNSALKYSKVAGNRVFTQVSPGSFFSVMDVNLLTSRSFVLPPEAAAFPSGNYGLVFYAGKFYISTDRLIFCTVELKME